MVEKLGNLFIDGSTFPLEDQSTNGYTITNTGVTVATGEDILGVPSIYFNGSVFMHVPANTDWDLGPAGAGNDWTIDFWIKHDDLTGIQGYFASPYISNNSNGNFGGMYSWSAGEYVYSPASPWLAIDTWYHIAMVKSGTTVKLYRNGLELYTGTDRSMSGDTPFAIGATRTDASLSRFLKGYVNNFRVVKGEALWTSEFSVDTREALFYPSLIPQVNPDRPDLITELYDISHRGNLRGKRKAGFIRPTVKQFFTSKQYNEVLANQPPVANPDSVELTENRSVIINLLANDTDPELQPLTVTALAGVAHGSLEDHGDGTVTYTPVADYVGSDSFGYTITDNVGQTNSSTCSITVNAQVHLDTTSFTSVGAWTLNLDPSTRSYRIIIKAGGGGGGGGNRTNTYKAGNGGRGQGIDITADLVEPYPTSLTGYVGDGGNGGPPHVTVSLRRGKTGGGSTCTTLGLSTSGGGGGAGATTNAPGANGTSYSGGATGGTGATFLSTGGKGSAGSVVVYEYT